MKKQCTIEWLDSFLNCKACEAHTLCTYHKNLLLADLRHRETAQDALDYEACRTNSPWACETC